jgi:hypothetical protein
MPVSKDPPQRHYSKQHGGPQAYTPRQRHDGTHKHHCDELQSVLPFHIFHISLIIKHINPITHPILRLQNYKKSWMHRSINIYAPQYFKSNGVMKA